MKLTTMGVFKFEVIPPNAGEKLDTLGKAPVVGVPEGVGVGVEPGVGVGPEDPALLTIKL